MRKLAYARSLVLLPLLLLSAGSGAEPARDTGTPMLQSFCPGETHELEVTYLGIPGLNVKLEVLEPGAIEGNRVFRARGTVRNSALVGLFYHIDDSIETSMDLSGGFTRKFALVQDESKLKRTSIETFDPVRSESTFVNHWQRKGESPQDSRAVFPTAGLATEAMQDTFSAIYHLRTLPFTEGATFTVPVFSEGRLIQAGVTVLGIKSVNVGGSRTDAYVLKLVKLNDDSKSPIENIVYLSADSRRALLEFSVYAKMGHVTAALKRFAEGNCQ